MKSRWAWLLALAMLATGTPAKEALPNADDPQIERRLLALTADLRCVVCQNESLAESRAPLAKDLRQEVRDLMRQGRSDREVVEYLTARYGDFVLYRPPFKPETYLLWLGPALFLGVGGLAWLIAVRRQRGAAGDDREAEAAADCPAERQP
ncbi:MAG: cytochrome c-type biogenesis protein CcmH [Gammaproteobacteria bacterium]|jgi:cytochrome c-type biogenesis protein CcmH|nr:cytochrome c-type biogenesis protein CcmH [Gammaproteobacteria bacterium]